jgi:hypothetical protein
MNWPSIFSGHPALSRSAKLAVPDCALLFWYVEKVEEADAGSAGEQPARNTRPDSLYRCVTRELLRGFPTFLSLTPEANRVIDRHACENSCRYHLRAEGESDAFPILNMGLIVSNASGDPGDGQANRGAAARAATMVLSETQGPIALFGYPRGHRV